MTMRILYATDGSAASLDAADWLAALPLDEQCELTILSVADPGARVEEGAAVEAAQARLAGTRAAVKTEVRTGHPVEEIVRAAEEHSAELLVVGSYGHSAIERLFIGSEAERVVRHAPCPVLLVRRRSGGLRSILLGIDGSQCSTYAAEWLQRSPLFPEAAVRVLTVLPLSAEPVMFSGITLVPSLMEELRSIDQQTLREAEERLDKTVAQFAAAGKQAAKELKRGHPAVNLLEEAEARDVDLIVVGSHGGSALDRFLLGSVSEHVLRHAPCSVLVVRSAPAEAGGAETHP